MTVGVIIAFLLASLAAGLVGTAVLTAEADKRRALLAETGQHSTARSYVRVRAVVERRLLTTSWGRKAQVELRRAAIHRSLSDVILLSVAVTAASMQLAFVVGGPALAAAAVGGCAFGARAILTRKREHRQGQFIDQLPELARLLANATQAGLSLRTAVSVAAVETQDPVRAELRQLSDEVALGASMETALERMAERLPSRELAVLVNVLIIQSRSGGQVVTALRGVTESLEARRDLRREVRTLLAGSKATALAVVALGLLIVAVVQTQVDGGLRGLLAQPEGLVVSIISGGLFVVGIYLIRRFSRIDV